MRNENADYDDARWERLVDAAAAEEPISGDDRDFLAHYEPTGESQRAELELLGALGRLGDDDGAEEEAANSPLVNATVRRWVSQTQTPQTSRRWPWMAAAGALLAAGFAAWWFVPAGETADEPEPQTVAQADEPVSPPDPEQAEAPPPPPTVAPRLRVASGEFVQRNTQPRRAGDPLEGGALEVRSEKGCIEFGSASACFDRGSKFTVADSDAPEIDVHKGSADVQVSEPLIRSIHFDVAGDRYEVAAPVKIVISVTRASNVRVEVTDGTVTVVDKNGRAVELEAPAVRKSVPKSVPAPVRDAKTLLSEARASRARKDRRGAISAYTELVTRYPDEPVAAPAMVTLGELHLSARQPRRALKWFDRYLARGAGPLAEEAHYGRIKALQRLGRDKEAERATAAFLARYPSSSYAAKLK